MSREALARTIPLAPPIVKRKMNPRANSIGVVNRRLPPKRVAQGSAFSHFRLS